MREIVLASTSPRRTELLNQIGIKFKVVPSDILEKVDLRLNPEEIAQSLAYRKASSVAGKLGGSALVIGADTIVVKDGILGKPENEEDALRMLKSLRGEWHSVITGICVIDTANLFSKVQYEETRVKMKNFSDQTLEAYIKSGEPFDKAGSYGIQGVGALLVERIEGCYFNVVGLPLARLAEMLKDFGAAVLG